MSIYRKKLQAFTIASLLTGVLVLGGWYIYSNGGDSIAYAQASAGDYESQIRQIDVGIQRFQSVTLDAAFLSSPGFRQLKDYSVILPPVTEKGKDNPFAALPEVEEDGSLDLPERMDSEISEIVDTRDLPANSFEFDTSFLDDFEF